MEGNAMTAAVLFQMLGAGLLLLSLGGAITCLGYIIRLELTPRDLVSRWSLSRLPEGGSPIKIRQDPSCRVHVWVEEKEHWAQPGSAVGVKADSTPYLWRRI